MSVLVVMASLAAVVMVVASTWWFTRSQADILGDRLRQTVLVTLKTGETYRGALFEQDRHTLVLRSAAHLAADGSSVGVDGELLILRPDIAYIQRP